MTLVSALANAMSGLSVAQHALDVTAHNVANVHTEGYTRKIVHQEAVILDGRGAGARATDTTRAVDDFLSGRILEQEGRLGRSEALEAYHDRLQGGLFGAPGDEDRGLGVRIGRLATAAEALAANPARPAQALGFLQAAQDLAREIAGAGAEIQNLRRDADQAVAREVAAINGELSELHDVNAELARVGPRVELLDRRDNLLARLAGRLDLTVAREERGTVAVYTRTGLPLLVDSPRRLVYEPAASVGPATTFGAIRLYPADEVDAATGEPLPGANGTVLVTGGVRAELTPELAADATPDAEQRVRSSLRAGRLQGLIEARDRLLPELADQLGELADMARHALNAAHNQAVAQPPPERLVGTRTDHAGFAAAARSGTAYVAVVDRVTGAAVTTVAVDLAAPSPAVLAAQLAAGLGPHGTATLNGDGALELEAAAGYGLAIAEGDSAVTLTDAAGRTRSFGFAHYFGLNDLLVADGASPTDLAVRPDLLADPSRLGRAKLDAAPGPPPSAALGGPADSRGARGLAAAFEGGAAAAARGSLPAGSYRLADYAAEIVAAAAVAAAGAASLAAGDRALAEDLAARQASVAGVNLDEELSRLVLYQQAYSVSARVVAIVDELLGELLAIGR